jgi:hypothetical protein
MRPLNRIRYRKNNSIGREKAQKAQRFKHINHEIHELHENEISACAEPPALIKH